MVQWPLDWNSLNDRIGSSGVDDPVQLPARSRKQVTKLFFGALASPGENKHLQIEELARGEVVARLNYIVNHKESAARIHAFLATGYCVDLSRAKYLADEVASNGLRVNEGFPVLDEDFQATLPGLYIVGQASIRYLGPFFGSVRGCIASARIVLASLQRGTA